jgi:hypothetical protein
MRRLASLSIGLVLLSSCAPAPEPAADGGVDVGTSSDTSVRCVSALDCDDELFCNGAEACDATNPAADSRGCVAGTSPCTAGSSCDESARECRDGCAVPDADGDGSDARECGGDDCDDTDRNRFPGRTEVCDAEDRDEDCDSSTYGVRDSDGDGYVDAACCNTDATGASLCGDDCNDMRGVSHPGNTEACDGFDNDCDTAIDEGVGRTFSPDADGDGFGSSVLPSVSGCTPPVGYVENALDCDDANAFAHDATAAEVCDAHDNDCDGTVDEDTSPILWYRDLDGDLFGDASDTTAVLSCAPVADRVPNGTDCDDTTTARSPAATELCNGVDDNCDGMDDTSLMATFYRDADGDGHGVASMTMFGCPTPSGYTALSDDCDDARAATHPGAIELCNNLDDDCSSGGGAITSEDADRDHHSPSTGACEGGYPEDDCDDGDASAYGGQTTFFATPRYCLPTSQTWCAARGCCIAPGSTCSASVTCGGGDPVFDYDCDLVETLEPPVGGSCVYAMGFPSGGTCTGSGPTYSGSPACGSLAAYRTCTVSSLTCTTTTSNRAVRCR